LLSVISCQQQKCNSPVQDCHSGIQSLVRTCTAIPRSTPLIRVADLPGRRCPCWASICCLVVSPIRL